VLLSINVRPEAFPTGSPMSVLLFSAISGSI
jgi:hypothetical protein